MSSYGSLIALLCYIVTVLLLYFIGDAANISILQFPKEEAFQLESEKHTARSIVPLLLALPVYIVVLYKSKKCKGYPFRLFWWFYIFCYITPILNIIPY